MRRLRRRSEARLDLLEAARRFRQLEAEPWCDRAEAELRACGGNGSSHRGPAAASALTGQELAVAAAVARGASNREVADELFLSPRTVEYHLSNVYRKLGVHGRSALASTLSASGDVDLTGPPDAVRVSLGKG